MGVNSVGVMGFLALNNPSPHLIVKYYCVLFIIRGDRHARILKYLQAYPSDYPSQFYYSHKTVCLTEDINVYVLTKYI